MKVTGIIAEYNPFHNGHKHQIDTIKESGSDYIIAIMSGDFVQRGEPALIDKYSRARMALENGVDLVIELPVVYALSDAGTFARGGVTLLNNLGVVDELCFGVEKDCETVIASLSDFLTTPPADYEAALAANIKSGMTYPVSRAKALSAYFDESTINLLSGSNMILGIEYINCLKKLGSSIKPVMVTRLGNNYNDTTLSASFSSASSIREALLNNIQIKDALPANCLAILDETYHIFPEDISSLLRYRLNMTDNYTAFMDIEKSFSDRVRSNRYSYDSFNGFADLIKTKNITHASVRRLLMHILLEITTPAPESAPYARVLGFNRSSSALLNAIKRDASIPLITKLADADMNDILETDIKAAHIYDSLVSDLSGQSFINEFSKNLIILN